MQSGLAAPQCFSQIAAEVPGHDAVKIERAARALAVVVGGGDQQDDARPQGGNVAEVVFGLGGAAGLEVRDQAEPQLLLVPCLVVAVQIAVDEDGVTAACQYIIRHAHHRLTMPR